MAFDFQGFQSVLEQQKKLDEEKLSFRNEALNTVKELVAEFGFTADELGVSADGAIAAPKAKRTIAPKYQTPEGTTWSGRGKMPKAFEAAVAAGHSLESMLINKA